MGAGPLVIAPGSTLLKLTWALIAPLMIAHLILGVALAQADTKRQNIAPPITLNDAFHMSIEQAQSFLDQMPSWLGSAYAKTDPTWRQELLWRAGRAAWLLSKPAAQLKFADELDAIDKKLPIARAYALILRSRDRQELGQHRAAFELVAQAAALLNASQQPEAQALAQMEFCAAHYSHEQTELALRACERGERILLALPKLPTDSSNWTYAERNRAWLHANTENYLFIAAENTARDPGNLTRAEHATALFTALKMPTMVSMVQDNLSGYYLENNQAEKALAMSQASLKLELAQGRLVHAVSSLINIGSAQSRLGQHANALASIEQAMLYAKQVDFASSFSLLYELQMDFAAASGDLALAHRAARSALDAKTKNYDQQNSRAVAEMDARFQAAEQTRQIERLAQERKIRKLELETSKAENARQAARLSRNNLWLWLVTISTGALLIVASLFLALWRASKRNANRMRWLADTDGLTQLLNRRAFVEQFAHDLLHTTRSAQIGALCILDIDHFKSINDAHGHPVGDLALKRIASLIRASLVELEPQQRPECLANQVGRLGGEEFAVWLPSTDQAAAYAYAEQLRKRIAEDHLHSDSLGFAMSISVGIAAFELQEPNDVVHWLSAADRALYRAKNLGRNRCELATSQAFETQVNQTSSQAVI